LKCSSEFLNENDEPPKQLLLNPNNVGKGSIFGMELVFICIGLFSFNVAKKGLVL
jgi:hypothetical protein